MPTRFALTNAEIEFDDMGVGAPILLLHGFPATRWLWSRVAPQLAKRAYRVLVPDLIGYGSSVSAPGTRLDMLSQAGWMWELLDALQIQQAFIVAHDVGSAAAQLMVVASPERVRGLVLLDGVWGSEWAMDAVESIRVWNPVEAHRLPAVLMRRLGKSEHMRAMLTAYAGESGGRRLIAAARDLDPQQTASIGPALQECKVPSLVLWGRNDRFLDADAVGRPLADLLDAPLRLLPGGHFIPSDCPEEVTSAVCDFVSVVERE